MRRRRASLLVSLGVDPGAVMDQLGHANAAFTLRVYRHSMRRNPHARRELAKLVGAVHWAPMGTSGAFDPFWNPDRPDQADQEAAALQGLQREPERGLEPLTLRLQGARRRKGRKHRKARKSRGSGGAEPTVD